MENRAVEAVNRMVRLAVDAGMAAARTALVAAAPWLNLPVVRFVTNYVFDYLADHLYEFFSEHSTLMVIDFQDHLKKVDYLESLERLRLAQENGEDTHEAREDIKRRLSDVISWRP